MGTQPERARGRSRRSVPKADLRDPGQLAVAQRHLRHGRRGRQTTSGSLRHGGGLHRDDDRVGLRGVGQRLVLPAVLRRYGGYPVLLPATTRPTATRLVQPVDGRVRPRRRARTVRTAAPASARATTRGPAPTRAAPRPTVHTARAARRRPTTRAPARRPRRGRARTSTAAGADRRAARRPVGEHVARHEQPDRRRRRARRRAAAAAPRSRERGPQRQQRRRATGSGDVYAGRDGNVYRKQGGGWQKYDNGNWGAADRPSPTTRSAGAGTCRHDDGAAGARLRNHGPAQSGLAIPPGGHVAHERLREVPAERVRQRELRTVRHRRPRREPGRGRRREAASTSF